MQQEKSGQHSLPVTGASWLCNDSPSTHLSSCSCHFIDLLQGQLFDQFSKLFDPAGVAIDAKSRLYKPLALEPVHLLILLIGPLDLPEGVPQSRYLGHILGFGLLLSCRDLGYFSAERHRSSFPLFSCSLRIFMQASAAVLTDVWPLDCLRWGSWLTV